jgi:hypothetical protein
MPHFPWMAIAALRLAASPASRKPQTHALAAYVAGQKR